MPLFIRNPSDTIAVTDQVARVVDGGRAPSDTVAVTDSVHAWAGRIFDIPRGEELYVTDRVDIEVTKGVSDQVAVTDRVDRVHDAVRAPSDTVAVSDSVLAGLDKVIEIEVSDTVTVTDDVGRATNPVIEISDTVSISDHVALAEDVDYELSDTVAVTDAVLAEINPLDNPSFEVAGANDGEAYRWVGSQPTGAESVAMFDTSPEPREDFEEGFSSNEDSISEFSDSDLTTGKFAESGAAGRSGEAEHFEGGWSEPESGLMNEHSVSAVNEATQVQAPLTPENFETYWREPETAPVPVVQSTKLVPDQYILSNTEFHGGAVYIDPVSGRRIINSLFESWIPQGTPSFVKNTISQPDAPTTSVFGKKKAIIGGNSTLFILDEENDVQAANCGRVYFYRYNTGTDVYDHKYTFDPPSLDIGRKFGFAACAISIPTAGYSNYGWLLAASIYDGSYGILSLFKRANDTTWNLEQEWRVDEPGFGKTVYNYSNRIHVASDARVHFYLFSSGAISIKQIIDAPVLAEVGDFGNAMRGGSNPLKLYICDRWCTKGGSPGSKRGAVHEYDYAPVAYTYSRTVQPTGLADNDEFGSSIDFGSFHYVIGAPGDTGDTGKAYLYQHKDRVTGEDVDPIVADGTLTGSDAIAGSRFGAEVAASAQAVAAGAPEHQVGANANAGKVFIFSYQKDNLDLFTEVAEYEGTAADQQMGISVELSSTTLFAGTDDDELYHYLRALYTARSYGATYVYTASGTLVQRITIDQPAVTVLDQYDGSGYEQQDFVHPGGGSGQWLAVTVISTTLAVVLVFEWSVGAGEYQYHSTLSVGQHANDWPAGIAISDTKDFLVVAMDELNDDNHGGLLVYQDVGGTWTLLHTLTEPDIYNSSPDHNVVAADGWTIAAGAVYAGADNYGRVWVYNHREQDNTFYLEQVLEAPADARVLDASLRFGANVEVLGDILVCSSDMNWVDPVTGKVGSTHGTGAVFVFRRTAGVWTCTQRIDCPVEPTNLTEFGRADYGGNSLALYDSYLFITCPRCIREYDEEAGYDVDIGIVFIYEDDGSGQYQLVHQLRMPRQVYIYDWPLPAGVDADATGIAVASQNDGWYDDTVLDPPKNTTGAVRFYSFPEQRWNHHSIDDFTDDDLTAGEFDTTPEEVEDFEEDWNASNAFVAATTAGIGSFGGGNSQEDFDNWTSEMQW